MSVKDCDHHKDSRRRIIWRFFAGMLIFLFVVLLTILIIWAVLQPKKPTFILQDVTVYAFNLTAPNALISTFQVTVISRNRNDKIGIYYDRLLIFATYNDQQITLPTAIPPTFQDTKSVNIWSPFLTGKSVPIAPFIGEYLSQDQADGIVPLLVNMDGRVRWRVGAFVSGSYRIHVVCPADIAFGKPNAGMLVSNNVIKYQLARTCSVRV